MSGKMTNIYLYTRYERFWHWLQMALILVLLVTGFEVHDKFTFLGYETAVTVHNYVGLTWLIAFFNTCETRDSERSKTFPISLRFNSS